MMSGRKDVIRTFPLQQVIAGVKSDIDLSASFESEIVNVCFLDNVGLTLTWSNGTTPIGEIFVSVTNQKDEPGITRDFVDLDFGSQILISSNSGSHLISINQLPFEAFKVRYVRTSGDGDLEIFVQAKSV